MAAASPPTDLPPSEWSIDYFSVDPEGEDKWARDTGLRRLSASAVRSRNPPEPVPLELNKMPLL